MDVAVKRNPLRQWIRSAKGYSWGGRDSGLEEGRKEYCRRGEERRRKEEVSTAGGNSCDSEITDRTIMTGWV